MKTNNIPPYILCSTPDLTRQVLEKIERESDLRWSGDNEKPSEYIPKSFYPNLVIATKNILRYGSSRQCELDGITNFTKAEDFLLSDETKIRLEELDNKLDKLINDMTNKTWDNLSNEDVLINKDGNDFNILEVLDSLVALKRYSGNDHLTNVVWVSKERLIGLGFKIKGASEENKNIKEAILFLEQIPVEFYGSSDRTNICKAIEMLKKLK